MKILETEKIVNERNQLTVLSIILASLPVHIYRWLNMMFTHDSTLVVQGEYNNEYQIQLGRFLQPVYTRLRGGVASPVVIAVFSLIFLCISAVIIISLLNIKNKAMIAAVCVFLAASPVFITGNALFLPWVDIYAASLFFAVLGVWATLKYRYGILPGALCFMMSMGLYQSFLQAALCMTIVLLIAGLLKGESAGEVLKKGLKILISAAAGCAAYLAVLYAVLSATGIELQHRQNSISYAYSGVNAGDLLHNISLGYRWFAQALIRPEAYHVRAAAALNILVAAGLIAGIIYIIRKKNIKISSVILIVVLLAVFPLAATFEIIFTGGYFSSQMGYAFVFFYIGEVLLADRLTGSGIVSGKDTKRIITRAAAVLCALLFIESIIYSNQFYLRKDLEFRGTYSVASRICSMIEETEGYEPGETTVVFEGNLNYNVLNKKREGFDPVSEDVQRFRSGYAFSHFESYMTYFYYILGYDIKLADRKTTEEFRNRQEVLEMPVFPEKGCCRMIDGYLVLRFTESMDIY